MCFCVAVFPLNVFNLCDLVREARLTWLEHVQRSDSGYIRVLNMELADRRKRENHREDFWKDMQRVGVVEEDAADKVRWRWMICHGEP